MDNTSRIEKCDLHGLDTRLLEAKFLSLWQTQTNPGCTWAFNFRFVGKTPQLVTTYNFTQKLGIIVAHFKKIFRRCHVLLSLFYCQRVWNETHSHLFLAKICSDNRTLSFFINVKTFSRYSDSTTMVLYQCCVHNFDVFSHSASAQSPLS